MFHNRGFSLARIKLYIQYIATILLLGYVFYSAGLFSRGGWNELITILLAAKPLYLIAAFLFTIVLVYVSAIKWYFLSKSLGLHGSLYQLFCFYMIGRYFNLVLPSSIGGDISRIYLQGKAENNKAASAATVFVDRITGLFTLVLLALLVIPFSSEVTESNWVVIALIVSVLVLLIASWIVLSTVAFTWVADFAKRISPKSNVLFSRIDNFRGQVLLFGNNYSSLLTAIFWSFVFYLAAIINVWLCIIAFDSSISIFSVALAVPIIMIIMNMPISIGNIGILEFSHVVVLGMFGVDSAVVLSAIFIIRLKSLFAASLGWIYFSILDVESPADKGTPNQPHEDSL